MSEVSGHGVRFELEPPGCFVALLPDGLCLGLRRRGMETQRVPFEDLTHVEATGFGVWLATRKTTQVIRRAHFRDPRDPDELVQAIRWRLAERPGGDERLARMREVAERARRPRRRIAASLLVVLCVAVFGLQWADPFSIEVGVFDRNLVALGQYWRVVTGNLLHSFALLPIPAHLLVNLLCLMAFGLMVERPLGALRSFLVMGAGGLGSMLASGLAGYTEVLGASGIVAGLVGALLWLEFNEPERLPAWWRIPRRLFIGVVVLQGILDQLLPFIAAAAHLGGLAAGFLVMPFVARGGLERAPLQLGQRMAVAALAVLVLASLTSAGRLVLRDPAALASFGEDLLAWSDAGPGVLNDLAWRIVTESEPDREQAAVAVALAERAVARTARLDPNILDTLAEALFVAGEREAAVAVIDEAIQLAGSEVYFREQRRRFLGERAADDRPDPPAPLPPSIRLVVPPRDPGFSI